MDKRSEHQGDDSLKFTCISYVLNEKRYKPLGRFVLIVIENGNIKLAQFIC